MADYYEKLIPVDDIFDWIKDSYDPTDIYGDKYMDKWAEEWAEENGYKQQD